MLPDDNVEISISDKLQYKIFEERGSDVLKEF